MIVHFLGFILYLVLVFVLMFSAMGRLANDY